MDGLKPLRRVCAGALANRRHMLSVMLACAALVVACAPATSPAPVRPSPTSISPQRNAQVPPVSANPVAANPPAAAPDRMPSQNAAATDPCAMLLHDQISFALLDYYIGHGSFPDRLDQLREQPDFAQLPLACPVSGKPYGYAPQGLLLPQRGPGRTIVLVYESVPAHSGFRWAIQGVPGEQVPGNPQVTTTAHLQVIPVLESTMRAALAN